MSWRRNVMRTPRHVEWWATGRRRIISSRHFPPLQLLWTLSGLKWLERCLCTIQKLFVMRISSHKRVCIINISYFIVVQLRRAGGWIFRAMGGRHCRRLSPAQPGQVSSEISDPRIMDHAWPIFTAHDGFSKGLTE